MKKFQTDVGNFPLSPEMWKHVDRFSKSGLPLTKEGANHIKAHLIALADQRHKNFQEPVLTVDERALLAAADRVHDLHTQATFLNGKELSDFGFDHLDQVHGILHTNPCGCQRHLMHDHYAMTNDSQPHRVLSTCDKHAHLKDDPKAHHEAISKGD